MDIPVMPHPGTDTQASPYQSRQTKETTNNLKQMNMKKKNSIKRAQSQARLSFAERKNFRPMAKILTLLVLLMTAVTGAWADDYYLVGSMNNWAANAQYKLTQNPYNTEEYMITLTLEANAELKVIGVNGGTTTWYPDNADNYKVKDTGNYTVYFRPDYGSPYPDWYIGCIYLSKNIEWTNIVANSDMEGTDVSCFYVHEQGKGATCLAPITAGIGKDDSRAIKLQSSDDEPNPWDTQFFIRLPYVLPAGTQYKLSFDYKADNNGDVSFQINNEPGQYVWYSINNDNDYVPGGSFTTSWQHYEETFTVPAVCDGVTKGDYGDYLKVFRTINFQLSLNKVATQFIFDNVKVEISKDVLATLTPEPATDPDYMMLYVTNNATNEWQFTMLDNDVEFEVEYYPLATLATTPAAAEGVVEGTDAALLTPGTSAEGTLAYAIGTSEAPTGQWSDAIPTAQDLEAGTCYVWYKVVGDAEHSDSQPQSIAVTIAETPAYAVTIDDAGVDASNWQATPAEQQAGQTVTLSYGGKKKVKSITIEKAATASAAAIAPALMDGATVVIEYNCDGFVTYFTFTNNGGTYSCNITGDSEGYSASLTKQGNTLVFVAHHSDIPDSNDSTINFDTTSDTYSFAKKAGEFWNFKISVNGTDITEKLSETAPAGPVTYTELNGGEVLHVGDIINPSEMISFNGGYYMGSNGSPFTVLRADVTYSEDDWDWVVNEKADGKYYVIKSDDGDYYHFEGALGVTSTSDGILVTYNGISEGFKDYTFTVHEP